MNCEPTTAAPPTKKVLRSRDIRHIHGKLQSLETLKNMPRAALPEMQYFIWQIQGSFMWLLSYAEAPRTKENREMVEMAQRGLVKLENLAIRVIVQGQSFAVADAELNKQMP